MTHEEQVVGMLGCIIEMLEADREEMDAMRAEIAKLAACCQYAADPNAEED